MVKLPPLSLYIHIPWCVQKCPYCDFNSHALKGEVPHDDYVQHLLCDLDNDVAYAQGREVKTIFIGGGTPSLLSGPAMQTLLDGVRARLPLAADAEITMSEPWYGRSRSLCRLSACWCEPHLYWCAEF